MNTRIVMIAIAAIAIVGLALLAIPKQYDEKGLLTVEVPGNTSGIDEKDYLDDAQADLDNLGNASAPASSSTAIDEKDYLDDAVGMLNGLE